MPSHPSVGPKIECFRATEILDEADFTVRAKFLLEQVGCLPTDGDVNTTVRLLREVYDRGRVRGAYEERVGC